MSRQVLFWGIALAVLLGALWLFSGILLPFVAGMALAYLLDPVADRLQRLGLSRVAATALILSAAALVFLLALLALVPTLVQQTADFAERFPGYVDRLRELGRQAAESSFGRFLSEEATQIQADIGQYLRDAAAWIVRFAGSVLSGGLAIVNMLAIAFVTPVVAFYLLVDWDRMVARVDSWLPREHADTLRGLAKDIDDVLAGFLRGQLTVCVVLGVGYAVGLSLIGLNFGLLIGLFAGLISFIPYVGSIVGFILSVTIAIVQFWPDWPWIVGVIAIFVGGQFIEGNILQPNLVGRHVRLHPVWLMFALFAFGYLFGFVGMLLAVPLAAAIGVVTRFALARYLDSPLYLGRSGGGGDG